ncbi:multidrug transporter [Litorimonas cladophorae]|uniref:Multidrug transporter n=2 Tax=Litorimonas cladophorae TaxID=1220491 RepID=A0A918NBP2_9PROT|nr:multidrug transporter [Litorimonas cladophorae]
MVDVAVRTVSPDWLVAFRMSFGAGLVLVYAVIAGHRLPPLRDKRWVWYSVLGLTGASLPFVLIAIGMKSVDSGLSAIIVGAMPLITIILAHFFTDEKLTAWKLLGFVMGFGGIIILFLPTELSLTLVKDWQAQLLILMGATCYALTTVIASRAPETPSPVAATMMLFMGALISVVWAYAHSGPPTVPNATALFCIIALGLGSTGAATVIYLWVIDMAGPSAIARINYFVPVCSVILGVWLLNEPLDWRIFVSLAVIILGVIISKLGGAD